MIEVQVRAKPPVVTEELRRWWLDRFTLDEFRELAAGLMLDDTTATISQ